MLAAPQHGLTVNGYLAAKIFSRDSFLSPLTAARARVPRVSRLR
jgi:hypothetical protein